MAGAFRRAASREMDKLKKMSAGDRIWYLWEYYRFHLFVCLALLAVIGYAGSILYRNSFDTVLTCYVVRSVETESGGNADVRRTGIRRRTAGWSVSFPPAFRSEKRNWWRWTIPWS